MPVSVTLVDDDTQHHLLLPAHVPIALLEPDLCRLTGRAEVPLASVTGRPLDPERSLTESGVRDGALLQLLDGHGEPTVYDDAADAARNHADGRPRSPVQHAIPIAAGTMLAALWLAGDGYRRLAEGLALLGTIGAAIVPRAALRYSGLHPDDDPNDPGAMRRIVAATRTRAVVTTVVTLATVVAGAALAATSNPLRAVAGWACLALAAARPHGGAIVEIATATGCCVGVAAALDRPTAAGIGVGIAGTVTAGVLALAHHPGAAPAVRAARERAAVTLTALCPVLVVAASGVLPGLSG